MPGLALLLLAWWVVYGVGRQVGADARAGFTASRKRSADRLTKIRTDPTTPRWRRKLLEIGANTGPELRAVARGCRYVGRSVAAGARWGVAEGRTRWEERSRLAEVRRRIDDNGDRERDAGITEETAEYAALRREYWDLQDKTDADRAARNGGRFSRRARKRARTRAAAEMAAAATREEYLAASDDYIDAQYPDWTPAGRDGDDQPGRTEDSPTSPTQRVAEDAVNAMDDAEETLRRCPNCDGYGYNRDLDDPLKRVTCRICGGDGENPHYPMDDFKPQPITTPATTGTKGGGMTPYENMMSTWKWLGESLAGQQDTANAAAKLAEDLSSHAETVQADAASTAAAAEALLAKMTDEAGAKAEDRADAEAALAGARAREAEAKQLVEAASIAAGIAKGLAGTAETAGAECASARNAMATRHQPDRNLHGAK